TYDRYGEAGLKRGAGAGAGGFAPFDLSEALNIFMRDFGGLGGFDAFFGGSERAQRERHRGQDLKVTLKLSLAEVASGTTKKVKVRTLDRCTACGCTGEGTVIQQPCPKCQGDGRVRADKELEINVPAGVADHHYLTMRGHGVPGPRNGPAGDLIAVLDIAEDPRFERQGDDLIYDLPVSFTQAALGA